MNKTKKEVEMYRHGIKPKTLTAYRNGKQKLLHRAIMEDNLGRGLLPYEVIHHINKDKYDNRIENLFLTTKSGHKKIHNEIGEKTRFKPIYQFNEIRIFNIYLKEKNANKIAQRYKCSEITIRRLLKKIIGENLRKFAKRKGWKYAWR